MNKWVSVLGAAALGLAIAVPAQAQLALDWIDTPPAGDAWTTKLENEAGRIADQDAIYDNPRAGPTKHYTVAFDYFYPAGLEQAQALGPNGVIFLSVVSRDPKDLPLKRVELRFGPKVVPLEPIAQRQSTVAAGSSLAKAIGANRADGFFLLPGNLPAGTANLWVVFATPGRGVDAGRLSLTLRGSSSPETPTKAAQLDPVAIRKVLAQMYPDLVKP